MSSLAIRNMNWVLGQREMLNDELFRKWYEKDQSLANCQIIRDSMTQAEYDEWWTTTPDGNHQFYLATCEKVEEIKRSILA